MRSRRSFLRDAAAVAFLSPAVLRAAPDYRYGLELYTVRNLTPKDYEGTIAKVAEIGYKEVEPVDYGGMSPKQYRAMLDKYGLTAPSTHAGATDGPGLEKELEGFQIMGILYTEIRGGSGRGPDAINKHGEIAKKFGMKMLVHNHTAEFSRIAGSSKTNYDVLLAETDPTLVAMQLDIGWAAVAGQNVIEMFHQHPGRFELWHVKDAQGIAAMTPDMSQAARMKAAKLVPVGEGEVDYKAIFANAALAGMKHFCIEQDNAIDGDSLAAAATSYRNLHRIL